MKRTTVIVPLTLPRLSDAAAAHLLAVLHELLDLIEHHYGAQAHRHRKRRRDLDASRPRDPPPRRDDPL
jgi:hypothetical protein